MSRARHRVLLAALLTAATAMFAYAVIHERSLSDTGHGERARETHAEHAGESPGSGETATSEASRRSGRPPGAGHVETASEHAREGRVLGVDLESTPMIVLAILAGIALAIAAASPLATRRSILLALALAALAWSALDIREIVHQANESRTDLTIIAAIVTALHAAAATLAISLALTAASIRPRPTAGRAR
jgi:hypothetical protein